MIVPAAILKYSYDRFWMVSSQPSVRCTGLFISNLIQYSRAYRHPYLESVHEILPEARIETIFQVGRSLFEPQRVVELIDRLTCAKFLPLMDYSSQRPRLNGGQFLGSRAPSSVFP